MSHPPMTTCIFQEKEIDVEEALGLRRRAKARGGTLPFFTCIECSKTVRAHEAGDNPPAHFEHQVHNPQCKYSVGTR